MITRRRNHGASVWSRTVSLTLTLSRWERGQPMGDFAEPCVAEQNPRFGF
jgi:hypothetical protein